jgi:hypothetical protein
MSPARDSTPVTDADPSRAANPMAFAALYLLFKFYFETALSETS